MTDALSTPSLQGRGDVAIDQCGTSSAACRRGSGLDDRGAWVLDVLADWVNARGPVILDRMYEMLPLMAVSVVAATVFVYWACRDTTQR